MVDISIKQVSKRVYLMNNLKLRKVSQKEVVLRPNGRLLAIPEKGGIKQQSRRTGRTKKHTHNKTRAHTENIQTRKHDKLFLSILYANITVCDMSFTINVQ